MNAKKLQGLQKLAYSPDQASYVSSLSRRTIEYKIASGELAALKIGRRILILAKTLEKFLSEKGKPYVPTGPRGSNP